MIPSSSFPLPCPCQSILSSPTSIEAPTSKDAGRTTTTTLNQASTTYCQSCISNILLPTIQKHHEALERRNKTRNWCRDQLLKHRRVLDCSENSSIDQEEMTLISPSHISGNNLQPPSSVSSTIEFYRDELTNYDKKLKLLKDECTRKTFLSANNTVNIEERMKILDEDRMKIQRMQLCMNHLYQSILISDEIGEELHISIENKQEDDSINNHERDSSEKLHQNSNLLAALNRNIRNIKYQRFQLALKIFEMHRMDVGEMYNNLDYDELLSLSTEPSLINELKRNNDNKSGHKNTAEAPSEVRFKRRVYNKQPNGIGKVCGMPIPHAGQELFGVLPPDLLTSSLRLVATMTNLLARCLGIVLPHPILLRPLLAARRPHMSEKIRNHDTDTTGYKSSWKPNSLLKTRKPSLQNSLNETSNKNQDDSANIEQLMMQETGDITLSINVENEMFSKITSIKDLEKLDEEIALLKINVPPSDTDKKAIAESPSASSLKSFVGSSSNILSKHARRALEKMKGHNIINHDSGDLKGSTLYRPMDKKSISHRLKHASYAIICESNKTHVKQQKEPTTSSPLSISSISQYELIPPLLSAVNREEADREKEKFTMALQLLQNNIISLSIKAGVPEATLWPAEAMLLNLYSLKLYCLHQISS